MPHFNDLSQLSVVKKEIPRIPLPLSAIALSRSVT
jgi:hypothetical protein